MNNKHHRLTGVLILLLALIASHEAFADVTSIDSASPNEVEQGTVAKPIKIRGSGFDKTVKEVKFLVHCNEEPCEDDSGGITVTGFKVNTPTEITAIIDVSDTAKIGGFDIQMRTRGRGGKGTTFRSDELFTVKLRGNQTLTSCDVFAPNGTCTCMFGLDVDTDIYNLTGDCHTSETLWLGSNRLFGTVPNSGWTITAVNCDSSNFDCSDENGETFEDGFLGSSVIANRNHVAGIRSFNIRFEDDVTRGCDLVNDDIQSAVSFRLHDGISEPPTGNSFLQVWEMNIDSHADPLCNAIEIVREAAYTEKFPDGQDWKASAQVNEIADDSYVISGILYEGMKPQHSLNPPLVWGNTIGSPACEGEDPLLASAIQFGPVLLSDTTDPPGQIAGIVESNTIRMATGCGTLGGVGIWVVGEPGDPVGNQTTARVVKNDISGALIGVLVDENVVDVNFTGNILKGDNHPDTDDIGIYSEAQCTRMKGKPNKITDYTQPDKYDCP